jgi:hypothetical protein
VIVVNDDLAVELISCTPVITCHIEFIVAVIITNINLFFSCFRTRKMGPLGC